MIRPETAPEFLLIEGLMVASEKAIGETDDAGIEAVLAEIDWRGFNLYPAGRSANIRGYALAWAVRGRSVSDFEGGGECGRTEIDFLTHVDRD